MNHQERAELVSGFDLVLDDSISVEDSLAASETGQWPAELRSALSGMGFFDLALDEATGGLGLDMRTLASLCITTGYRLLPPSLVFETLVLAPALAAAGAEYENQLDGLRAGTLAGGGCLLGSDTAVDEGSNLRVSASPKATIACVLNSADQVAFVDLEESGVVELDPTDLLSRRLAVDASLEDQIQISPSVRFSWLVGSLADCIGAASAVLDMAVEYSKERKQFGQPLFRFQAISHRLADMRADVELGLSSLSRLIYLAETESSGFEAFLTSLLHAIPLRMRSVCEGAIQVHGGMGFTWEAGLHLYYRRVLQTQAALGGTKETAAKVGELAFASLR